MNKHVIENRYKLPFYTICFDLINKFIKNQWLLNLNVFCIQLKSNALLTICSSSAGCVLSIHLHTNFIRIDHSFVIVTFPIFQLLSFLRCSSNNKKPKNIECASVLYECRVQPAKR